MNSIVAIHGIGAHPDDAWVKNVGSKDNPEWVNWLSDNKMLPSVVPKTRIMRYGYQSAWFGERDALRNMVSIEAQRLLVSIRREREVCHFLEGITAELIVIIDRTLRNGHLYSSPTVLGVLLSFR